MSDTSTFMTAMADAAGAVRDVTARASVLADEPIAMTGVVLLLCMLLALRIASRRSVHVVQVTRVTRPARVTPLDTQARLTKPVRTARTLAARGAQPGHIAQQLRISTDVARLMVRGDADAAPAPRRTPFATSAT